MNIFIKAALVSVLFCLIENFSFAQYAKFVVVFTDKNNSPYSFNQPVKYLSQKSIGRRTRYHIKIDSTDLPVNPSYISKVLAQGKVTYLSQSKWLNQILIVTTDTSAIKKIKKLSIVKYFRSSGPLSTSVINNKNKFKETISPITNNTATVTGINSFNYGNAYNQIHIHNGEYLHNKGFTGKGITITIIDAGFNSYKSIHAFDSTRAHNRFLGEKDFVDYDNSVNEDDAHGEECLSIIAANVPGTMVGSAPDASFWLLRSENVNSEFPVEEHNWAVAAEFGDSAGTDMISSSLGYNLFDDTQFNHSYSDFYKNKTMISRAATLAARKGILVTNSAGNNGDDSWRYLLFPADDDSVCAVAATNTSGVIATFSSYGYPGKVKPNIASVGLGTTIYTSGGVSSGSGTSFSNPNINGLIACLWQAFPQFSNMVILRAVYESSNKFKTPDNHYGYGIPNMQTAYDTLKAMQNNLLFGDKKFIAVAHPAHGISFKFIGQVNGTVIISLVDAANNIIASKKIITEYQEVYNVDFDSINNTQGCSYSIQYNDGKTIQNFSIDAPAIAYNN